ncbi:MAG: 7-carboxy-7-deazaguanine synthase [Hyphomicrobiaceae bacterium]|nr:MAG: 7-carboxy-7-deazaguanine synthase [Hyphomicrobiaceae bacterium]
MTYAVKEIFYTLQGEGANAGRPAVFCRFSGCNLWSGREEDRYTAVCQFCDTDFVGINGVRGGNYRAEALAAVATGLWPVGKCGRFIVLTGGEPLLQVDKALLDILHANSFTVAVETNGTKIPPEGIDWLCVSPKAGTNLVITVGDELKLVFPQPTAPPAKFANLQFKHFFLQPMAGPAQTAHTNAAVRYCLAHPQWHLSVQTHKILGIP